MQAFATVLEMVEKRGGESGGVECGRVEQLPIPNRINNGEDEFGGAADIRVVECVVLEAHLPDGLEPSHLVLLFFRDCWIGADALGEKEGFFVHLELVGGGSDDSSKVMLCMVFVVAILEENRREGLAEAHEVVVGGLAQDLCKGLYGLRQEKRGLFRRHGTARKSTEIS